MKLMIYFDIDIDAVYIPDGYISNMQALQNSFLDWADDQQETFIYGPGKRTCKRYTCELFLRYLNEQVLAEYREKAYRIATPKKPYKNTYTKRF